MAKRYELSDEIWAVVVDLFTETHGRSRPRLSDRLMLDGMLRVLRSGACCVARLPERFGRGQRCTTVSRLAKPGGLRPDAQTLLVPETE
ncbi:transposase [Pseudomonas syringae]|nr:transposase [Pseudomonas syringae]